MKKNNISYLLLTILLLASTCANSEHYYGVGAFGDVYGFAYEHAWDVSSAYGFLGFQDYQAGLDKEDIRSRFGYRSYIQAPAWESGWFTGAVLADYGDVRKQYRPGIGFELGKQWMKDYVRFTFSGSIALASKKPFGDDVSDDIESELEPIFNFGLTAMLRSDGGDQEAIERELPEEDEEKPSITPKNKSWWKFWQGLNDL